MSSIKHLIRLFTENKGSILVLTGAGCSTDSGLQDYRGKSGVYTKNPNFKPISYQSFCTSFDYRKRYWSRSFFGYKKIFKSLPNYTHFSLHRLEQMGYINRIITQNVDNLHQKAGSKEVINLHGSLDIVSCLNCKHELKRLDYQLILEKLNQSWTNFSNRSPELFYTVDGDVILPEGLNSYEFRIPSCYRCLAKNSYKPKVVFFGENIASDIKNECFKMVEQNKMLLVVGSSLATPSAYNIVKAANREKKKIAIVNLEQTRGDIYAELKIQENCSNVFQSLLNNILPAK